MYINQPCTPIAPVTPVAPIVNPDLEGLFDDWTQGQLLVVTWEGGMAVGRLSSLSNGEVKLYDVTINSPVAQTATTFNILLGKVVGAGLVTT